VRSLAADLGPAPGGGAHLRRLRRTAVGPFTVAHARPLDRLGPDDVLPPARAVAHLARVAVDEATAGAVRHGAVLRADEAGMEGEGPWAVVDRGGVLLAVYERRSDGTAKPSVVLASH
jgi:tRNA pseudouridine55 synthase